MRSVFYIIIKYFYDETHFEKIGKVPFKLHVN